MPEPHEIRLSLNEFDRSKLPIEERELTGESFRLAVRDYLIKELAGGDGATQIIMDENTITIRWDRAIPTSDFTKRGIERLQDGDYDRGIALLQKAIETDKDDCDALFNLGMALSDQGRLTEALLHLERLVGIVPEHVNGLVALAVAKSRASDTSGAVEVLQRAVAVEPENAYARRNLGMLLAQMGSDDHAIRELEVASRLLPGDPQLWLSLARLQEKRSDDTSADASYQNVLRLAPHSQLATAAQEGRSRIVQRSFHGDEGPSKRRAVEYCADAMRLFARMPKEKVKAIAIEIAMLGTTGIDVHDPAAKYTLRHLGGHFTGLQLLAIEYVAFKIVDPSVDIGFDLQAQYLEAKSIVGPLPDSCS